MLTVSRAIPAARGLAPSLLRRAARLSLSWDDRSRSRFDATDSSGRVLGVFLPRGTVLRGGDVLVAEDGSLIAVDAAPQPVMTVRHCPDHGAPHDLLRAAYHLGNRHVAVELQTDHLQIEPDPVLAEMLRGLHLLVDERQAAFEPEAGAYANAHVAGHGHRHTHEKTRGHTLGHDHDHDHDHDHSRSQPAASVNENTVGP